MNSKSWILPMIVIAQFCSTSLWFAGNAVMGNLIQEYHLATSALAYLTSAVQLGFIIGALIFAILTISDRFSPSKVFFISAFFASFFNLVTIAEWNSLTSLIFFRFATGFCLAGIYPVGMKLAADHFEKGLGKSLGYLVGALVLGTALPHLLMSLNSDMPWRYVLLLTSSLAIFGGTCIYILIPDGPYRKPSLAFNTKAIFDVFKGESFRSAAFGYFGHMWELYTFWAFTPVMLSYYAKQHHIPNLNIPLITFFIIGIGGIACVIGGYLSLRYGAKLIAAISLSLSGICCLISPFSSYQNNIYIYIGFLLFWGMMVIADSPLLSTLVAQNAPSSTKGTALTTVTSLGFGLTIVSILLMQNLLNWISPNWMYATLAIGPLFGLYALLSVKSTSNTRINN